MSFLKASIDELIERLSRGRELGHASFEPVYYVVFPAARILEVKREIPTIEARLKNQGWQVHIFSLAEAILELVRTSPVRDLWLKADAKDPLAWEKANESIANTLSSGKLASVLGDRLGSLHGKKRSLLLVTDLEALHPYLRIGAIEGQLSGRFVVPTVFLYPGERTGKSRLKFLGFYPDDGNYRSVHIGG